MKHLFNFGISQDDAETEKAALEIKDGDRVICLASAGEVPLNLLAANDISIDAVDVSQEQICLSKLKLAAAIHLDQLEAARLIGYMPCTKMERKAYFERIALFLDPKDQTFWSEHPEIFSQGPVHRARFEKYLAKFNKIVVLLMGRKRLLQFCELDDVISQQEVFDKQLRTGMIRLIFKIAFHPRIYKNRGMDAEGLKHSGTRNITEFFFSRFRYFFIATSARKNFHLHLTLFNKVLFKEALPLFLQDNAKFVLTKRSNKLTFYNISIEKHIEKSEGNQYNKFALSNIGDWLSVAAFNELIRTILSRSNDGAKIFLRYIHYPQALPEEFSERITIEQERGKSLETKDRYPFYNLVPMKVIK
jgi:S-adenosylmethionine-diacylglycerol 3-amino-3-carboxypropyl transferase